MITDCPILYQDTHLVLIHKPAGLLSHPNPGKLTAQNRGAFLGPYHLEDKTFRTPSGSVWLLHRLDQDTSGILMGTFDPDSARFCREAFETGKIRKEYLTVVRGDPGTIGTWKDHLTLKRQGSQVRSYALRGYAPNAELRFKTLDRSPSPRVSLLKIELLTGKTHQIRVQANSRQHPLLGDDIYGDFGWNKKIQREFGFKRLFLHAHRLEFTHPKTRKKISVEAPISEELIDFLKKAKLQIASKTVATP